MMKDIDDFLMTLFLFLVAGGFASMILFGAVVEETDTACSQSHRFETTVD